MGKTIRIKLGTKELRELKSQISNWRSKLAKTEENIVGDLSNLALEEMQKNYENYDYKAESGMDFQITGTNTEKKVSMIGTQAIYTEFGTGTVGGMNSHPKKQNFNLKQYNSGETIRVATKSVAENHGIPEGTLYWTYTNESGETIYTQGIPAGKQVYDAAKTVRKQAREIAQKRIDEVFE